MNFYKSIKPLFLLLGLLVGFSTVQAQSAQTRDGRTILEVKQAHNQNPDDAKLDYYNNQTGENGMPVFIDTNDPQGDAMRYEAAKSEWVSNNPEAYNSMVNTNAANDLQWIGSENNGDYTTHYVKMNNLRDANHASEVNSKLLNNAEVHSSSVNFNTKMCTVKALSTVTLEDLFGIQAQ